MSAVNVFSNNVFMYVSRCYIIGFGFSIKYIILYGLTLAAVFYFTSCFLPWVLLSCTPGGYCHYFHNYAIKSLEPEKLKDSEKVCMF